MVSILYIAMIIVGGLGSVTGAVYGALFMSLVPELLRAIIESFGGMVGISNEIFFEIKNAFFGLTIILFLVLEPKGLYGIWIKLKGFFKTWPYTY